MTHGHIKYVSDTLLIDDLYLIHQTIQKQAGEAAGVLNSLSSYITSWAKENIDTSSTGGFASSLLSLITPGVLFKINPILGIIWTGAKAFGFDPMSVVNPVVDYVSSKFSKGESVSADEVETVGKSAISASAGPLSAKASMLEPLYEVQKNGQIVSLTKEALWPEVKSFFGADPGGKTPVIPWLGDKKLGIFGRIFGNLFQMKAKGKARWLLGGLIVWVLKTALLGAGLLAGAGAISKALGKGKDDDKPSNESKNDSPESSKATNSGSTFSKKPTLKLKPSGRGEDYHKNDGTTSTWIVPIVGGDVQNTLLLWTLDIYPQLKGRENLIKNSRSFNKTVNELKTSYKGSSRSMEMPKKFHSRKQVVDQFIYDLIDELIEAKGMK